MGWSSGSAGVTPLEGIALCPGRTDGSSDTAPVCPSLATPPVVWLLTCSVSPKESLWMTWVMSGFCGWAVALCVDTWKLPGTWGERQVSGVWWAAPEVGHRVSAWSQTDLDLHSSLKPRAFGGATAPL